MSFCLPILLLALTQGVDDTPVVTVDGDNVRITESCRVRITASPIADTDNNGVIQIVGNGITVTFEGGPLIGADPTATPDSFEGTGIRVNGQDITVSGAVVRGFRVGIFARKTIAVVIEDCDVSGNFSQRLASMPTREDPADWIRPHDNQDNEWFHKYGAGVYVRESSTPTIRRVRAWGTQNGIVLSNCLSGRVYDNDCSFGSGWGIALWRARNCTISRNACDFRIRGYSHDVYNRGQDSAGILLFEQCTDNVIIENSATHCGDGLFAFSGLEALGQAGHPYPDRWYLKRGNKKNIIAGNDFSYAAAHGIEVTFGFANQVVTNRVVGAAICGFWGGYSHHTFVAGNHFESNGDRPYGLERGGVNIEHGYANVITGNRFLNNACGVHLWWDDDPELAATKWARANSTSTEDNSILGNTFEGDAIAVHLRSVGATSMAANTMIDVGVEVKADEESLQMLQRIEDFEMQPLPITLPEPIGETTPIGARTHLKGREKILMTEWGPYDWTQPTLRLVGSVAGRYVYELIGPERTFEARLVSSDGVTLTRDKSQHIMLTGETGLAYELHVTADATTIVRKGVLDPKAQ